MCLPLCVCLCVHVSVESALPLKGLPLKGLDEIGFEDLKGFCTRRRHRTQCDASPTVSCCAISVAVAQISMDRHEVVSPRTGCACLSESEILTAIHQPKEGRAPGLDEISPERLKCGGRSWLKILPDCV